MTVPREAEVVLLSQFFPPESAAGAHRVGTLAEALRERCRLRVVTLEPGYPEAHLYSREQWHRADVALGVPVTRLPAFHPHDASLARRALREIGMSASLVRGARLGRPRVLLVSTPSMFLAPAAWAAARLCGARLVWDLRDLTWRYALESVEVGPVQRALLGVLERGMAFLLRRADLVVAATPGIAATIREQGVREERVIVVLNGVARRFLDAFADVSPPPRRGRPRVTYVGVMGYNQGIGILLDVARALPEMDVSLVGDGPERPALEARLRAEGITNVTLHGYVTDQEELAGHYRDSDLLVAHMRPTPTLDRISFPSKTFEYFATSRPVVYAGDGAIAELLRARDLATVVPPEDPAAFARGIRATLADREQAATRAQRARAIVAAEYCREDQMRQLAEDLTRRFELGSPETMGRAPRIAVVTTVHRWGDPRVFERETAAWLEWKCDVQVFVPAATAPERCGWSASPSLRVHAIEEPRNRRQRMALALGMGGRLRREGPFDLVHFHDAELIPAMAWLALLWPRTYFLYDVHEELPLEVHSKAWIPAGLRPFVSFAASVLWRGSGILFEGFAPATEAIARHWPPERTRVVHNYPKALFATPAGEPPAPDRSRLIYVGGLTEVRGIRAMFEAVRDVRRRRPDLRVDVIGRVIDASLAEIVARAVAEGWCRHTPWLPPERLASACRGAGVGLVPYLPIRDHLEALPTKIFEYMAMGIPILASDFPLWRELIENSGCGRVADPTGPGFAATLEVMLGNAEALAAHAARGRAAYSQAYRWEVEREQLRWHLDRALELAQS